MRLQQNNAQIKDEYWYFDSSKTLLLLIKRRSPLRRIFYVFKNTFNTDTKFRVFFFWYSLAEGEFIE